MTQAWFRNRIYKFVYSGGFTKLLIKLSSLNILKTMAQVFFVAFYVCRLHKAAWLVFQVCLKLTDYNLVYGYAYRGY